VTSARERAEEAASAVGERAGETASAVAQTAQQAAVTAGRTAVELTSQALNLPDRVRASARRSLDVLEDAGTQIVVTMLNAGSRALNAAADYVNDIVPRRRVRRAGLEQLLLEQMAWTQTATDALERSASEIDDDGLRVRLVRCKLQAIRQGETLTQLIGAIGGGMREPERMPRVRPVGIDGARGPDEGRVRHDLARALSIAVQQAEGWKALAEVAALAEQEGVATALGRACETVGTEPQEQIDLLQEALLQRTVEAAVV
jgi:hypothetical protein